MPRRRSSFLSIQKTRTNPVVSAGPGHKARARAPVFVNAARGSHGLPCAEIRIDRHARLDGWYGDEVGAFFDHMYVDNSAAAAVNDFGSLTISLGRLGSSTTFDI